MTINIMTVDELATRAPENDAAEDTAAGSSPETHSAGVSMPTSFVDAYVLTMS
jgi:hypothetical protein